LLKEIAARSVLVGVAAVLIVVAGCAQQSAPPAAKDPAGPSGTADIKSHLRTQDADFVAALAAKDIDKVTSFYADDAQFLEPGAPIVAGRDEVHKAWAGLLSAASFVSLTFSATNVNVSEAGDVAWEVGTYDISTKDAKGKPTAEKGKYVVIWKKQSDGNWKIEVDMDNPGV